MMISKLSPFIFLLVAVPNVMTIGMPGGLYPQDPNNPKFMRMAWKAVKYVDEDFNSSYMMVPIKVTEAWSQVVGGINYYLVVLYGESACEKNEVAASEAPPANCQYRANGNRALYNVKVHTRPWQHYEHFTVEKIRDVDAEEEI
ncbi:unnamed protein product [Cylicocyclus nassatus]|uniref:Cystatin domain-containing protein n=1 Tax=Cylicocyclus nassatus TaxID=53992 RepID=A0AA36H4D7_CYLNA|nr:unnamed protein product [Cylicocyclus nassatus]